MRVKDTPYENNIHTIMTTKSQYKGVTRIKGRWVCRGMIDGHSFYSFHATERDAARTYDLHLIRLGRLPVNIYRQQI